MRMRSGEYTSFHCPVHGVSRGHRCRLAHTGECRPMLDIAVGDVNRGDVNRICVSGAEMMSNNEKWAMTDEAPQIVRYSTTVHRKWWQFWKPRTETVSRLYYLVEGSSRTVTVDSWGSPVGSPAIWSHLDPPETA
jgi:hypothetical protein